MFSLTDNIENILLSRVSNVEVDDNIFRFFIRENKRKLELEFYKNNMIARWNYKSNSQSNGCEMLYVMYEKTQIVNKEIVNEIFRKSIAQFAIPSYTEYKIYISEIISSSDIIKHMINSLTGEKVEELPEDVYDKQSRSLLKKMSVPFVLGIHTIEGGKKNFRAMQSGEICKVSNDNLAFMGQYCFSTTRKKLDEIMGYKVLEKMYGSNEVTGIYFPLRCEGKIYLAVSSFVMEEGLFITGVMANYSKELHYSVMKASETILISEQLLENSKRLLMDDIRYVAYQYGELVALLPYVYAIGKEINLQDLIKCIENIQLSDVCALAERKKNLIAIGVNE